MRNPDFLVVGAAKSGTTALWKYFQNHPQIFVTSDIRFKELGYYSDIYGINDKDKYLEHFLEATENQMIGEVCHAYLSSPNSAQIIKREAPAAKIIIMLRNPAKRAFSLYNWMVMSGYEKAETFEEALQVEDDRISGKISLSKQDHSFKNNYLYFNSGLYADQVERFYKAMGAENVKVYLYEDFKQNQNEVLNSICSFIGVDEREFKLEEVNKSVSIKSARKQYYAYGIKRGFNRLMSNAIGRAYANKILENNIVDDGKLKINKETYDTLMIKYKSDINRLSEIIKIDLNVKWGY